MDNTEVYALDNDSNNRVIDYKDFNFEDFTLATSRYKNTQFKHYFKGLVVDEDRDQDVVTEDEDVTNQSYRFKMAYTIPDRDVVTKDEDVTNQ